MSGGVLSNHGTIQAVPSYKGSCKCKISEYLGERTSSTDHMNPKLSFDINFTVNVTKREEWAMNNLTVNMLSCNIWYTDGSKTEHGTGPGYTTLVDIWNMATRSVHIRLPCDIHAHSGNVQGRST